MKILNLGSLNIDRTYSVEHFVQPKETIHAVNYEEFCGGKGLNQSVALARAGAEVYHAGAVGIDGGSLIEILKDSSVNIDYLQQLDGVSGHAVIQLDVSGQNNIIIFGGTNRRIDNDYISQTIAHFDAGDILVLQNEISNVGFAMEEAKRKGLKIAYNPAPMDENVWKCDLSLVDYFIVNEVEGRLLAGIESDDPEEIKKALKAKFPGSKFVLTLGESGVHFFEGSTVSDCDAEGNCSAADNCAGCSSNSAADEFHPSYNVDVVDTTGAGDTFTGYFLAAIAEDADIKTALKQASAASAIGVGRKGAAPSIPSKEEVLDFILRKGTTL